MKPDRWPNHLRQDDAGNIPDHWQTTVPFQILRVHDRASMQSLLPTKGDSIACQYEFDARLVKSIVQKFPDIRARARNSIPMNFQAASYQNQVPQMYRAGSKGQPSDRLPLGDRPSPRLCATHRKCPSKPLQDLAHSNQD